MYGTCASVCLSHLPSSARYDYSASYRLDRTDCSQLCLRSFSFDHFWNSTANSTAFHATNNNNTHHQRDPYATWFVFQVYSSVCLHVPRTAYFANIACVCNSFRDEHEIRFVRLLLFNAIAFLSTRARHTLQLQIGKRTEHKFFCRMREKLRKVFLFRKQFFD